MRDERDERFPLAEFPLATLRLRSPLAEGYLSRDERDER
jgi:hypothetical protein